MRRRSFLNVARSPSLFRILEDMKVLREMARVRRERSGSTSSLSSTHSSNSAHSRSDSISSTSSSGARPGPNADDNEEVFLSSPVEQEGVQGFGTSRPLPTPPASAVSPVAPSVNFAGPGYETATAKKVKDLSLSTVVTSF
ncbi:hypothetical protein K435DRAFT_61747 [Dendrothele bispora CBS 962.96]|uniref:Uncharacterized protein n=1 Tax=Dendrothele bispora (strain CBS 962.96) TaxID=1314807 RepID=A0A4S8MTV7_DENBC|nr:hypothetical protein K435DRAFT_61747 [Dendrothele bispora CBS 962.96]